MSNYILNWVGRRYNSRYLGWLGTITPSVEGGSVRSTTVGALARPWLAGDPVAEFRIPALQAGLFRVFLGLSRAPGNVQGRVMQQGIGAMYCES